MKTFKALRKPSTGQYWTWESISESWILSETPDLLRPETVMMDLKLIGMIPEEAGDDLELAEVFVMSRTERSIFKKSFIEEHPLQLLFHGKRDIKKVKQILKEANENYVLDSKDAENGKDDRADRCQINIVCPTTSFANAYYHIGAEIGKRVLAKRKED